MTEPEQNPAPLRYEDAAAEVRQPPVIGIVRFMGAILMLGGGVFAFDGGGVATFVGITDSFTQKALGFGAVLVGVTDFFVVPLVLRRSLGQKTL